MSTSLVSILTWMLPSSPFLPTFGGEGKPSLGQRTANDSLLSTFLINSYGPMMFVFGLLALSRGYLNQLQVWLKRYYSMSALCRMAT